MHDILEINQQKIALGERKIINLSMPQLYDCTPMLMPVHVIRGKKAGPILCLSAAIHGDELNGIEIIRRILRHNLLKQLKGTLVAIPIVNMYGFLYQDRYLMDRRDLNRVFPGSEKGSLASRLAHLIATEIISKVTHSIDLHTGSMHRINLPQIRISNTSDDKQMLAMAKAFHPPVILKTKILDGSLRQYTANRNIPSLLYEAGESLRFDEFAIRTGVKGILNVMDLLGMIKRPVKTKINQLDTNIAQSNYWVRAPHSGIFQPKKVIGQTVKKDELLATIGNPTTTEEHSLYSPIAGIIIGKNLLPNIHEGAALFHIASFESIDLATEHVENLQDLFDENVQG
ncbi:M14 family metallopeptidase [Thiotrichales bacterium 19S3-7]|nr:M14 family metallopeptidase [Thiotrichales bacterium 19S3-7]MCF6802157.1 M14 family metallopeptidase [Thiotrichales bacterium 19S3-11]